MVTKLNRIPRVLVPECFDGCKQESVPILGTWSLVMGENANVMRHVQLLSVVECYLYAPMNTNYLQDAVYPFGTVNSINGKPDLVT